MKRKMMKGGTVGAIMKKEFLAVSDLSTIEETIKHFRGAPLEKVLKPSYVYVIDSEEHLVGVVQMRDLLSRSPNTYVKDIMLRSVVKVDTETDTREAIRLFVGHKFLALPVINKSQRLVGIITADDMVDVAGLQADKDIAMIVGTSVDEITSRSIPKIVKLRLPWLAVSILSGLTCAFILGWFEHELKTVIALALFIPVVLGLSESTGMQSATIVVRNMALGKATFKDVNWLLHKEIWVGVIVGLICGLFVGGTATLWQGNPHLGSAVALSISLSVIVSGAVGACLPFLFRSVRIDPALASGPIILATCDIITLLIYFRLSGFLLMGT
ncbi:MAG: magnesium transporter [Candidatus Omnitrophota bacterium]|nr:magnesium transporter [Candidatus Omnitrophota bacterium]